MALVENSDFLISICSYVERAAAISKFLILDIVVVMYDVNNVNRKCVPVITETMSTDDVPQCDDVIVA